MKLASLYRDFAAPGDLDKLLNAFLMLDRAVVEFYMQIYRTPPDHQFAILMQNQFLHSVLRERVPELLLGCSLAGNHLGTKIQKHGKVRSLGTISPSPSSGTSTGINENEGLVD